MPLKLLLLRSPMDGSKPVEQARAAAKLVGCGLVVGGGNTQTDELFVIPWTKDSTEALKS